MARANDAATVALVNGLFAQSLLTALIVSLAAPGSPVRQEAIAAIETAASGLKEISEDASSGLRAAAIAALQLMQLVESSIQSEQEGTTHH